MLRMGLTVRQEIGQKVGKNHCVKNYGVARENIISG